jgi:hypothetical protein
MVVTRRTPVVPAPPVSRTPSSQGQPRSVRAAVIQDASVVPRVSSPLASGDAHSAAIITGASNNFKEYNDKVSSHNEFLDEQIEYTSRPFASSAWSCVTFGLSFPQFIVRG